MSHMLTVAGSVSISFLLQKFRRQSRARLEKTMRNLNEQMLILQEHISLTQNPVYLSFYNNGTRTFKECLDDFIDNLTCKLLCQFSSS